MRAFGSGKCSNCGRIGKIWIDTNLCYKECRTVGQLCGALEAAERERDEAKAMHADAFRIGIHWQERAATAEWEAWDEAQRVSALFRQIEAECDRLRAELIFARNQMAGWGAFEKVVERIDAALAPPKEANE
jgi:hypothetical protein